MRCGLTTSLCRSSSHHSTDAALSALAPAADVARYLPPPLPGLRQASSTLLLLAIDGTDRQTDGRKDTVLLHKRSPLEAGGVNKRIADIMTVRPFD